MDNLLTQNRSIYRIRNTDLFISIHEYYLRDIREGVVEYQSLANVPSHQKVKGIVFKVLNEHLNELQNSGAEIQIPINCLEFDLGDLRLSA
jgi:hypothetical protein